MEETQEQPPSTSIRKPPSPPAMEKTSKKPSQQQPPSVRTPPKPTVNPRTGDLRSSSRATSLPPKPSASRMPPPVISARGQQPPRDLELNKSAAESSISSTKSQEEYKSSGEDWVEVNDDVYSMFFLSSACGQSFWYSIYIFVLKMALYTFLITDAIALETPEDVDDTVLVAQFLMLPVAVAMQDDLIGTFFLIANIKYSPLIRMNSPHASKAKFHVSNMGRGIDGLYSLLVNFVILLKQTSVLNMFLSFAALQFLQTIDNIAIRLCENGYLTSTLEEAAERVMTTRLPYKTDPVMRSTDSILFLSTLGALTICWAIISFL